MSTKLSKNHPPKFKNKLMSKMMPDLYLNDELSDVKFAFEKNGATVFLPSHKLILATGSKVFRQMFFGSLPEKKIVRIVDESFEDFKVFLQFFYLPEVKLTINNIEVTIRLVIKYDMIECLRTCSEFLEFQSAIDSMIFGEEMAESGYSQQLKKMCDEKIEHFEEAALETILPNAFLNCDITVLKYILQMDHLAWNEVNVFNACMEWARRSCRKNELNENDSQNLKKQLAECFHLIRFRAMTYDEITAIMSNQLYAAMFDTFELIDVLSDAEPKIFSGVPRGLAFDSIKSPILVCEGRIKTRNLKPLNVSFQSNVALLLGEIHFMDFIDFHVFDQGFTYRLIHENAGNTLTIKIIKDGCPKVLFNRLIEGPFDSTLPKLNILKPVEIEPHQTYKICFEYQNFYPVLSDPEADSANLTSVRDLGEGVRVSFLSDSSDFVCSGLVKELHFKRI